MEIRSATIPADPPQNGTALTIGAYDGVHLGHRQVISEVRRLATERGLASAVVTFDRHPASVVRPESAPLLLTDTDQKLEQLATTGVDLTLIVPFDESRAGESAEDFVEEVLVRDLGARVVVVGEDFHFGHHRLGNVDLLRRMGASHGCWASVWSVPVVLRQGTTSRCRRRSSGGLWPEATWSVPTLCWVGPTRSAAWLIRLMS
mgnify:CR=1 FL=1